MKSLINVVLTIIGFLLIVGCGTSKIETLPTSEGVPDWVNSTPEDVNTVYSVGVANVGANLALAREKAIDAARQEMSRSIEVRVKNLMDRFSSEHKDFYDTQGAVSSSEFTRTVSRSVSQATLSGTKVEGFYHDKENNTYYCLIKMVKNNLISEIMNNTEELARQKKAAFLEQKTDEALELLDQELKNWDLQE